MTTRPPSAHGPWCTRCRNHSTQSSGGPAGFCSSGTLQMERWTRRKLKWWNIIKLMRSRKRTPLVVTNKAFRSHLTTLSTGERALKHFEKPTCFNQCTAYESADVKIHCHRNIPLQELTWQRPCPNYPLTAQWLPTVCGYVGVCENKWFSAPVLIHLQPWSYLTTARTFHFTFSMSTEEASCNSGGSYFAFQVTPQLLCMGRSNRKATAPG